MKFALYEKARVLALEHDNAQLRDENRRLVAAALVSVGQRNPFVDPKPLIIQHRRTMPEIMHAESVKESGDAS